MTFMVPYDGSYLSDAALTRATEYGNSLDEDVIAVTVIPENDALYARTKNWLDAGEPYDIQEVAGTVHEQVAEFAPEASFRYERADSSDAETIATEIQKLARDIVPSVVFLGSDNIGQITTPVTSVAGNVAEDAEYDVHVVRYFSPTAIQEIDASPEYPTASD
ncbi:MAG TPA: universal stress protein [Halococcus sp.]|nr:universal stress protein [Halococcus sp.]